LSDIFPIKKGLKQGESLSPLLFNLTLEYASRSVQVNKDSFKLSGTHQFLIYAADNVMVGSVHTIKKNTEIFVIAVMEAGP